MLIHTRHRIFPAASLALALLMLFATQALAATGDWTQYRHDPSHSGVSDDTSLTAANVSGLVPDWTATTTNFVIGSPSVADGVVYFGSFNKKMYARDAETGTGGWTTAAFPDAIVSSPAISNGKVYFGIHDYDGATLLHGKFYALNQSTGATAWTYPAMGEIGSVSSSPTVSGGNVYFGASDNKLYALNAATGAFQWSYTTGGKIVSSPAVANGVVYFGSYDGKLYAVDATTGVIESGFPFVTGGAVHSSPAVANGIAYVGSLDNKVYAVDVATGAAAWASPFTTGNDVISSPAVDGGVVYVGSNDDKVYALDAVDGSMIWSHMTGDIVASPPAVANGVIYVGSFDDKLYALDPGDGHVLWNSTTITGMVDSGPALAHGEVYVGSRDFKLYAFGLPESVPDSPTGTTAEAGIASAIVDWTAPAFDGNSPITDYAITSSPGGVVVHAPPDATSAGVPGLSNGTTYTFTVVATNAEGDSAASAASNAVTPQADENAQAKTCASSCTVTVTAESTTATGAVAVPTGAPDPVVVSVVATSKFDPSARVTPSGVSIMSTDPCTDSLCLDVSVDPPDAFGAANPMKVTLTAPVKGQLANRKLFKDTKKIKVCVNPTVLQPKPACESSRKQVKVSGVKKHRFTVLATSADPRYRVR